MRLGLFDTSSISLRPSEGGGGMGRAGGDFAQPKARGTGAAAQGEAQAPLPAAPPPD